MRKKFNINRYKAAVANGAKSTGPSTPQAKQKVAGNAIKHGLTAKSTLLPGEDPELLRQFAEGFHQVFQPANAVEFALVEEIVDAKWRLRRSWGTEGSLYQMTMVRNRARVEKEFDNAGPDIHYAAAFEHLANHTTSLSQLHRQETRLSRLHDKALSQLLTLQQIRREAEEVDTPESTTPEPQSNQQKTNAIIPPNPTMQNNPNPPETNPQSGAGPWPAAGSQPASPAIREPNEEQ